MENKNRNILVVLIAIVIVAAVFSSFGLTLYSGNLPEIVLPTPIPSGAQSEPPTAAPEGDTVWVDVTPQTVQSVIRTLSRPVSYYREISNTYEGGAAVTSRVWVDGGWTRTETTLAGGAVRHTLVGEGTVYYWYGGDVEARQAPADEKSPDLDGPHIPTYEDVLAVDMGDITDTGYEEKGGLDCVYVQVEDAELGYQTRYWISVDSRLLVAAETVKDGQAVMSMSGYSLEQPVASGTQFSLPDGTVLHTS